jgi:hypothetical protein
VSKVRSDVILSCAQKNISLCLEANPGSVIVYGIVAAMTELSRLNSRDSDVGYLKVLYTAAPVIGGKM